MQNQHFYWFYWFSGVRKTSKIWKKTPDCCVFQCKINIFTDFTGFSGFRQPLQAWPQPRQDCSDFNEKPVKSEKKCQKAVFYNAKSIFLQILLVFPWNPENQYVGQSCGPNMGVYMLTVASGAATVSGHWFDKVLHADRICVTFFFVLYLSKKWLPK